MEFKLKKKSLNQIIFHDKCPHYIKGLNIKNYIKIFQFLLIIFFILIELKYKNNNLLIAKSLASYNHYIKDCMNLKNYKRKRIKNNIPYISICIPVYNMNKYIEKAVLSILNQSFQNFEILIVNDFSNDNTIDIIKRLQLKDDRIKIINHSKNLGVYTSRVDGILASRGKYIILMDPDDMFLNSNLFDELYNYNLKYNLDIIEFTSICYIEKDYNFTIIKKYYHNHNFTKRIIVQPILSDIYYYHPTTYKNSRVQCRIIWNKIIKRRVILNSILYIGYDYYQKLFITADDIMINLICLHFSNNYSNINLPGYMYNIRQFSMTHGNSNKKKWELFCYNHLLYLKKLYRFIKTFNKSRNFLYYELKSIYLLLITLEKIPKTYKNEINQFFNEISNDKNASGIFKKYIKKLSSFL